MSLRTRVKALALADIDADTKADALIALIAQSDEVLIDAVRKYWRDQRRSMRANVPDNVLDSSLTLISDNSDKNKNVPDNVPDNGDFTAWYSAYPRKQAKMDAQRAWATMRSKMPPLADMLAALERQKREWKDPQFIPFPGTYLRAGRWADQPVEAQTAFTSIYKRLG